MPALASLSPRVKSNLGHGKARIVKSGLVDLPSVPKVFHPLQHIDRIQFEKGLAWYDIGEANIDESVLYPNRGSDDDCPVVKQRMMANDGKGRKTEVYAVDREDFRS